MDKISDEKLEELASTHGECVVISTKLGDVAFRAPKRTEYDRYLSCLFDDKKRHKAAEILLRACRVCPTAEEFDKMLEQAPGIIMSCSLPVLELAGQASEPEVRKSTR